MKLLFAASDRDLLECYKKLLETDCREIVTAFDGTQTLYLLNHESFDIVILDHDIPRIDHKKIILKIHEKGLPVILLIDQPLSSQMLSEEPLPNAYLSYPFTSELIDDVIRGVMSKISSGDRLSVFGAEIIISEFRLNGGSRLTSNEIDVLQAILHNQPVNISDGACISAINEKFAQIGSKAKIKYMTKKGFELVEEYE